MDLWTSESQKGPVLVGVDEWSISLAPHQEHEHMRYRWYFQRALRRWRFTNSDFQGGRCISGSGRGVVIARAWAAIPIFCLGSIVVKIKENQQVIEKSLYLASSVDLRGRKDLFGISGSEFEGAKYWLSLLADLRALVAATGASTDLKRSLTVLRLYGWRPAIDWSLWSFTLTV